MLPSTINEFKVLADGQDFATAVGSMAMPASARKAATINGTTCSAA
jgi:hypothetical protein